MDEVCPFPRERQTQLPHAVALVIPINTEHGIIFYRSDLFHKLTLRERGFKSVDRRDSFGMRVDAFQNQVHRQPPILGVSLPDALPLVSGPLHASSIPTACIQPELLPPSQPFQLPGATQLAAKSHLRGQFECGGRKGSFNDFKQDILIRICGAMTSAYPPPPPAGHTVLLRCPVSVCTL